MTASSSISDAAGIATSGATATLDELAQRFQTLPVASLAPAIVLLLGGLLLLIAGKHVLRPVMVIMTVLLGAMLGPSILGGLAPQAPGMLLAFIGGLVGLVFVAIAWRLVLGAATGIVAAFACAFIAMLLIDAGAIDARLGEIPGAPILSEHDAELHRAVVAHTPALVHPLVDWADTRWRAESEQVRVLLAAAAAGGGFVGMVLGAWMTSQSAALLTSLVGAIFTLVGAMPFLAKVSDRAAAGVHPVGWLCLWLALALAGWLFQTTRAERSTEAPAAEAEAGHPAGRETGGDRHARRKAERESR
jgi:hypothetical protein